MEDKMLACTREIKENKFYFVGAPIALKNLGNIISKGQLILVMNFRKTQAG